MSLTIKQAFEALSDACANGMKNPFFVMRRLKESFADVASKVVDASGDKVTVTQTLTEGTQIGSIKVNNDTTVLYAPAGGSGGIDYSTDEKDTGLKWIDGKSIYQKTIVIRENNVDKFTKSGSNYVNVLPSNIDWFNIVQYYSDRAASTYIDTTTISNDFIYVGNPGDGSIYYANVNNPKNIIITIQYTKVTV